AEQLEAEPQARADVAPGRGALGDHLVAVAVAVDHGGAGVVLRRAEPVVHLRAVPAGQVVGVGRPGPLQAGDGGVHADRGQPLAGRDARRGQQVAAGLHAVAHHVVEDAAALLVALPEPRTVRAAVLLGAEIGRAHV